MGFSGECTPHYSLGATGKIKRMRKIERKTKSVSICFCYNSYVDFIVACALRSALHDWRRYELYSWIVMEWKTIRSTFCYGCGIEEKNHIIYIRSFSSSLVYYFAVCIAFHYVVHGHCLAIQQILYEEIYPDLVSWICGQNDDHLQSKKRNKEIHAIYYDYYCSRGEMRSLSSQIIPNASIHRVDFSRISSHSNLVIFAPFYGSVEI